MAAPPAQPANSPSTARLPLGGPTRPNLDFCDNGWGNFLRLTPVPRKEQERIAPRTCSCAADNAASSMVNSESGSRDSVSTATKNEMAVKGDDGVSGDVKEGTEKDSEKQEEPALDSKAVAVP